MASLSGQEPAVVEPQPPAPPVELQLRLAWGSGTARQWRGVIQISEGRLQPLRQLGLEADTPGSLQASQRELRINQLSPRTYDGLDVQLVASPDATLVVELSAVDESGEVHRVERPVSEFIDGFYNGPLDEKNNRLLIRRTPGDRLRVRLNRESLVFSPGEQFVFEVQPHMLGAAGKGSSRCQMQLLPSSGAGAVWSEQREVTIGPKGLPQAVGPLTMEMPAEEGVYNLEIALTQRNLSTAFIRDRVLLERKVQLVVVGHQPPEPKAVADWKLVAEIDPANPGWWERMTRFRQLLPGFGQGPLDNGKVSVVQESGRGWTSLAAEGWQSFPLPIDSVGKPHILEVEYPTDRVQTLGVSILGPNAANQVVPLGLDTGVHVGEPEERGTMQTQRIYFWPRSKSPLVLLTHRGSEAQVRFGKIRIYAGPERLPRKAAPQADGRRVTMLLDKPLFPENFRAPEALDARTDRSLDDWGTFYKGGTRLVEYLRHSNFNSAAIAVACEGSAIYPSRLLAPTPKYDTGAFFSTGQDPVRKDVLELLFRLFDREGLTLIPTIQFASPLPAIERRVAGNPNAVGQLLVDHQGVSWIARHGTRSGLAPHYNPLDPGVQQAMQDVVDEVIERYAHHRSFAGVALQLGPDTYAQLPGVEWGMDKATLQRFESDTKVSVPGDEGARRVALLQPETRPLWTRWRANQMAQFHQRLRTSIRRRHPTARLHLVTSDLVSSFAVRRRMLPRLPNHVDVDQMMLEVGLDAARYANDPDIVLLRPHRLSTASPLAVQGVNLELTRSRELDQYFGQAATSAAVVYHEPAPLRLPSFDAASPYGPQNTYTWLVPHVLPSGPAIRRPFIRALAAADVQDLWSGGWMVAQGQDAWLQPLLDVYSRLPAGKFQTVEPADRPAGQPIIVRQLQRDGKTYLYLLNHSNWPVSVELELETSSTATLEVLGDRSHSGLGNPGPRARWRVDLQPYDLVGGVVSGPAKIPGWTVQLPPTVVSDLRQQVQHIQERLNGLPPSRRMTALQNPGFEPSPGDAITGWVHAHGPGIDVRVDTSEAEGQAALRIVRQRPGGGDAWVRSEPFPAPATGRMRISVRLRVADEQRQPALRLAIEGRLEGRTYYRFAVVGAENPRAQLRKEWAEYQFVVNDLPLRGLTDLRVGFDLMGPGEVWIDDVQTFDLWFDKAERAELLKQIALASLQLEEGKVADCHDFLTGYWSRFVQEQFPPITPRVADQSVADPPASPGSAPAASTPPSAPKAPPVPRWRQWIPRRVLPF